MTLTELDAEIYI